MRIIGEILLFAGGFIAGSIAITWHRRALDKLRNELFRTKMDAECDRAWQEGYMEGRGIPMDEFEAFNQAQENHRGEVTTKGARGTRARKEAV